MPSHAPLRWRRTTDATKPTTANAVMKMSKNVVNGKNMSQNESVGPVGPEPVLHVGHVRVVEQERHDPERGQQRRAGQHVEAVDEARPVHPDEPQQQRAERRRRSARCRGTSTPAPARWPPSCGTCRSRGRGRTGRGRASRTTARWRTRTRPPSCSSRCRRRSRSSRRTGRAGRRAPSARASGSGTGPAGRTPSSRAAT